LAAFIAHCQSPEAGRVTQWADKRWGGRVNIRARVLIAVLAGTMLGGFAPSAHAIFGLHRAKKNTSPYAYLAPKKGKKSSGWYQSTLTGKMVYGKPPKPKK
jgi:hypothetical protein